MHQFKSNMVHLCSACIKSLVYMLESFDLHGPSYSKVQRSCTLYKAIGIDNRQTCGPFSRILRFPFDLL